MYSETGESISGGQLFSLTHDVVEAIYADVGQRPMLRHARSMYPDDLVDLYARKALWQVVQPLAKGLCRARWLLSKGYALPPSLTAVRVPASPVTRVLVDYWPDSDIPLELHEASLGRAMSTSIRRVARPLVHACRRASARLVAASRRTPRQAHPHTIAVHYVEGIDLTRRSELTWFPQSGIDPDRVLLYFSTPDNNTGRPVSSSVLSQITQSGMRWTTFGRKFVEGAGAGHEFRAKPASAWLRRATVGVAIDDSMAGRLASDLAGQLMTEVTHWQAFFQQNQVRLHFTPAEGQTAHIAQTIACATTGNALSLGRQRSEMGLVGPSFGFYPFDVYFCWNRRCVEPLLATMSHTGCAIVLGYPNDGSFEVNRRVGVQLRGELERRGARFCVALYDNAHGPESQFSSAAMERYYRAFLDWVVADESVGLLIKSKKPVVLASLTAIHPLLADAEATGRCLRLPNERGRMPSEVASGADITVGIGISSAVTEAVISGARGVHYDVTHLYTYDYYEWGSDRLIFDDLERMMQSLRQYKEEPQRQPRLGDWSEHMDELDPFRDGRAGERMGDHMRWCMEGFEAGMDRLQVLRHANSRYAEKWGRDKVIDLRAERAA